MKQEGHTIIIYTARRMETHGGNIGKVIQDIGKITLDILFEINPVVNSSVLMKVNCCKWQDNFGLDDYDLWFPNDENFVVKLFIYKILTVQN
jgi:hypothetical protein